MAPAGNDSTGMQPRPTMPATNRDGKASPGASVCRVAGAGQAESAAARGARPVANCATGTDAYRCAPAWACPKVCASRIPALVVMAALVAMLSGAGTAIAQPDSGHAEMHEPLAVSEALGWQELIEQTLAHYPRFVELAAREDEAQALLERADRWLAAQPVLRMRYQTDAPLDDVSLRERELGIELPLWRAGQRRAATSLGRAALTQSDSAAAALRHEVIGLLRMALWDIERAVTALAVARGGAAVAAELQTVVERLYEAGEVPQSEILLMRSTALERDAAVIEAEALLVDAERAYQSLTGLDRRPAVFEESLTVREDFDSSHPLLMQADAEIQRARAALELTSRAAKGTPVLTIGPQSERGAFSSYWADSVNVSVSLPFGGRAHQRVATTAAARVVAEAESDRLRLLRQLDHDLHEARHDLLVIESSLELAQQRSELAARSFAMSQQAFTQGEMTLLEVLRREETDLLTRHEVAALEVRRQRAIARINHGVGEWP